MLFAASHRSALPRLAHNSSPSWRILLSASPGASLCNSGSILGGLSSISTKRRKAWAQKPGAKTPRNPRFCSSRRCGLRAGVPLFSPDCYAAVDVPGPHCCPEWYQLVHLSPGASVWTINHNLPAVVAVKEEEPSIFVLCWLSTARDLKLQAMWTGCWG